MYMSRSAVPEEPHPPQSRADSCNTETGRQVTGVKWVGLRNQRRANTCGP